MQEKEVKVLNVNFEEMKEKLNKLGAKYLKSENQTNIIIDTDNSIIKNELKGYLRIRMSESPEDATQKKYLTLKKKSLNSNLREHQEIQTEISDVNETLLILKELGFEEKTRNKKHRESYLYRDCRFDFDTWDESMGIMPYMEIEVQNDDSLLEIIKLLGIDRENISAKSIVELMEENNG